ncbi:hypothetical protein DMH04_11020 [Kibdelosporangium aridum]|uniref:Uncharacterized protein n=2 Tax=Kibdelosporangium aridum TaxID=2030 RepID=A0A428ZHI4_KIBAR|nr:hypothetical protein DMH04_11020 [Kibdelosporangium aridum]
MPAAVCAEAVRVVPGADIASVTVIDDRAAWTAASTEERAIEIDSQLLALYAAVVTLELSGRGQPRSDEAWCSASG